MKCKYDLDRFNRWVRSRGIPLRYTGSSIPVYGARGKSSYISKMTWKEMKKFWEEQEKQAEMDMKVWGKCNFGDILF